MLPGALHTLGAELVELHHLTDEASELCLAISHSRADVVITVGAASVGPADHLRPVLRELGGELLIGGVAVKPGHPQALARLPDQRLVVGLPGNLLAALGALCTLIPRWSPACPAGPCPSCPSCPSWPAPNCLAMAPPTLS
jgi:molybdopterin molybdotransferase